MTAPPRVQPTDVSVVARQVVELAGRAPSVHNTQPWAWQLRGDVLELHVDWSRHLAVADPDARNLLISNGAALHHAQAAARALGWTPLVERQPEGPGSTLVARLRLDPSRREAASRESLETIRERRTDRRRFTSWPVPDARVEQLAVLARELGAEAEAVLSPTDRLRIGLLATRARQQQAGDTRIRAELDAWIDSERADGVPRAVLPSEPAQEPWSGRFGLGELDDVAPDIEGTDALLVLGGDDFPSSLLRTGEALSAVWLDATRSGLAVVPLSQVVEVPETRLALEGVLERHFTPHLLLRLGWLAISRSGLPSSPRRPVDEVLRVLPAREDDSSR